MYNNSLKLTLEELCNQIYSLSEEDKSKLVKTYNEKLNGERSKEIHIPHAPQDTSKKYSYVRLRMLLIMAYLTEESYYRLLDESPRYNVQENKQMFNLIGGKAKKIVDKLSKKFSLETHEIFEKLASSMDPFITMYFLMSVENKQKVIDFMLKITDVYDD